MPNPRREKPDDPIDRFPTPSQRPHRPESVIEWIPEIIGWFKIMVSPALLGLFGGFAVYASLKGPFAVLGFWVVFGLGLLIGIIWATRVLIRTGTVNFFTRSTDSQHSNPESDV